jgi:hypothetical protein
MEWDTLLSLGLLLIVWNGFLVTMYLLVLGLLYGMGYFIVARLVAHCVELFSRYLLKFNLLGIVGIDFQVIADQYFSENYVECFSRCLLAHFFCCVLCLMVFQLITGVRFLACCAKRFSR